MPKAKPGGRKRTINLREVVNCIYNILRSGGDWQMMHHDLPPWSKVYTYYRQWRISGLWEKINGQLGKLVRLLEGRKTTPTAKLTLRNNSLISAEAGNNATGGNIKIDADFIVAFPSHNNGNDIIANAEAGKGGNINITAQSIFNLKERQAITDNGTNDIDVSSRFGLDGNVLITTPDVNPLQGAIELPSNVVELQQTVAQACRSDRITGKVSGLTVKGKGGIPPEPTEPMDSDTIFSQGQTSIQNLQSYYPEIKPIKTDDGDIYPARGVIKTEDGRIILTAYPTEGIDNRNPHIKANCSGT